MYKNNNLPYYYNCYKVYNLVRVKIIFFYFRKVYKLNKSRIIICIANKNKLYYAIHAAAQWRLAQQG